MDNQSLEPIMNELACIRSEVKAFKLEARAELALIKQELKELKNYLQQSAEMRNAADRD
ncbi:hypothetical protein [Brevibacillus migulae]|uniref:hypothetical protein n=1 Tax=Brevibacillus migulae TaxID=1644114 RepID=UPI0014301E4F|nr:hypothetical protein [Brevibacillus migulae]